MKIKINNKREGTIFTVEIESPQYPWQMRNAIAKAMELDGHHESFIDEVFNRQQDMKTVEKEEG